MNTRVKLSFLKAQPARKMKKILFLLFAWLLVQSVLHAATPALEREILISLNNESVSKALSKIQTETGVVFSYKSSLIDNLPAVTLTSRVRTVREILTSILPSNITFKAKDNYIILKEAPKKNPTKTEVNGYVYDKSTNKKIANVTIYDKKSLQSATTDEYGYYSMKVPSENQNIIVNKQNYKDTTLQLSIFNDSLLINIALDPVYDSLRLKDSLQWKALLNDVAQFSNQIFKKFTGFVNSLNIKDTLSCDLQVSLLPFIGTNHKLSGSLYNRFSLNIIGGYSKGTTGLEVGGLFNVNRENMHFVQVAGLFNLVGGEATGVQVAGALNMVEKSVKGVQVAGIGNINSGTQFGIEVGGLFNLNHKNTSGVTIAGVFNKNYASAKGIQVAGLFNTTDDTLSGISVAGLYNHSYYQHNAIQIAGLANHTKSGSANVQIAGLINVTGVLKGIQIAPFNFADSASGATVGFFSFVKKGVHQLELSSDEFFYSNLSFRTGSQKFYNLFCAGVNFGTNQPVWSFGYGVGSSVHLKNKLYGDLTLTAHHINFGNFNESASEHYRVYLGLEYKFGKKFSVAAGPTFNLYLTDTSDPKYRAEYGQVYPYSHYDFQSNNGINLKGWVGGRIALRFF